MTSVVCRLVGAVGAAGLGADVADVADVGGPVGADAAHSVAAVLVSRSRVRSVDLPR